MLNSYYQYIMKGFKYLICLVAFISIIFSFGFKSGGRKFTRIMSDDSLVKRTDNYIRYINAIGAHGSQYMKTYVKVSGKNKYEAVLNTSKWPDSITETVNVIYYNNEPAEIAETPVTASGGDNIEYDNYFYNGKLLAYRYFDVMNNSYCTGSTLTNTVIVYYDSTGRCIKTTHTLFDEANKALDPEICLGAKADLSHLYNSYKESPLAKLGVARTEK